MYGDVILSELLWYKLAMFLGEIIFKTKLRSLAGLPSHKHFGNRQYIPMKDRATCHFSFLAPFFERRSVTSPETLVSKGRHEYWN